MSLIEIVAGLKPLDKGSRLITAINEAAQRAATLEKWEELFRQNTAAAAAFVSGATGLDTFLDLTNSYPNTEIAYGAILTTDLSVLSRLCHYLRIPSNYIWNHILPHEKAHYDTAIGLNWPAVMGLRLGRNLDNKLVLHSALTTFEPIRGMDEDEARQGIIRVVQAPHAMSDYDKWSIGIKCI